MPNFRHTVGHVGACARTGRGRLPALHRCSARGVGCAAAVATKGRRHSSTTPEIEPCRLAGQEDPATKQPTHIDWEESEGMGKTADVQWGPHLGAGSETCARCEWTKGDAFSESRSVPIKTLYQHTTLSLPSAPSLHVSCRMCSPTECVLLKHHTISPIASRSSLSSLLIFSMKFS
jgi:hypothetical protein